MGINLFEMFSKGPKIYAVVDLSIFLLDWNNIGKPGWILDELDETDTQKFLNLLIDAL